MKQILLLGRNGFIGKHLYNLLNNDYEVIEITDKKTNSKIVGMSPDYVINLCASLPNANFTESLNANVLYPLNVLEKLLINRKKTLKWIQIGSYFELQIEFGRNDCYTLHKKAFRNLINELEISNKLLSVHSIILPHVTGNGEPGGRLFPIMKKFNQEKISAKLFTNGSQFLPILEVSDACTAILQALVSNQKISSAHPVLHLKVKDIVYKCVINASESIFNENLSSPDSNYPMVKFPENVSNFKPSHGGDELIEIVRTGV